MNKRQIAVWIGVLVVILGVVMMFKTNKSEAPALVSAGNIDIKSQIKNSVIKLPDQGGDISFYPIYTEKEIGGKESVVKNIIAVAKQDFGDTAVSYLVIFIEEQGKLVQKSSLILGEVSDIQSITTEDVVGADYGVSVNFIAPYSTVALNNTGTSNRELFVTVDGGVFNSTTAEFVK